METNNTPYNTSKYKIFRQREVLIVKKIWILMLCTVFLLGAAACTSSTVTKEEETSSLLSSQSEETGYTQSDRTAQLEEAAEVYRGLLTSEAIEDATNRYLEQVSFSEYEKDPVKAASALYQELTKKLYLRTDGSLIAPVAPDTLEEAKQKIREEFLPFGVEEEYLLLAEEMLESGSAAGKQDPVPYEQAKQESFDGARRMIFAQALHWLDEAA